nr:MAG TPA: hypothetical protein [Caudoviricetes sp.]
MCQAVIEPDGIFNSVATALGDIFALAQRFEKTVQNIQIRLLHFVLTAKHEEDEHLLLQL